MKNDIAHEAGVAAAKATPAIGVAAASVGGWGVQEWMYAVTTVYVIAQLAYLVWKWNRERKAK